LELNAIDRSLQHFAGQLAQVKSLLILSDNTSAVFSTRKGSAHSGAMAAAVNRVLHHTPLSDVRIGYIPTADNPADAPSRGLHTDEELTSKALGKLGGRWATPSFRVVSARRFSPNCNRTPDR
jgi:hypothetical protein